MTSWHVGGAVASWGGQAQNHLARGVATHGNTKPHLLWMHSLLRQSVHLRCRSPSLPGFDEGKVSLWETMKALTTRGTWPLGVHYVVQAVTG